MALFFIGFALIIIGLICVSLAIGRGRGLKWAKTINFTTDVGEAKKVVSDINEKYQERISNENGQNGDTLYPLGWFLIWLGIMLFGPSFALLRERYVKQYCDGKYEWEQSAYVNERGEVRPVESKTLVRVKDLSDRKTFYLQKDTTSTE